MTTTTLIPEQGQILPPETIARLERGGKKYAKAAKRIERLQWYFATIVIASWDNLPELIKEELTKENFYCECSYHINNGAGYTVIGSSGETLRRWCDVVRRFPQPLYNMPFEVHRVARSIGADPTNNYPGEEVVKLASENGWHADEIITALNLRKQHDPAIAEIRSQFAPWWGHIPDMLLSLNGKRAEVEYHMREIERIVGR